VITVEGISLGYLLFLFMLQGVLIIVAVMAGAYAVFRTKRDAYDPFMQIREPKGSAFNIGEEGNIIEKEKEPELPGVIKRMNERFLHQTEAGAA